MNPLGLALIAATALVPAFQLFSLPDVADKIALFSQYLGLAALVLMAWGQILSTRLPGIEQVFGGMDRVYVLHKWVGIVALSSILLHDTIDAEMRNLGRETVLTELAETLGELSLYGLLILVVISVATFIPYHLWKWTHKAMGALFAAGTFHFFFILKPFSMGDPAGLYTAAFCMAGLAAYVWMLLPETMRPSRGYCISSLEPTGDALAITMTPMGKPLKPAPGQFGVLRFTGSGKAEPHPFTFSGIGEDGTLRVSIKPLGDFTAGLGKALEVDQEVRIQGPFGRFKLSGKGPEVWVAGGIGVTPFLAWARALAPEAGPVDMFYAVRSRAAAPHLDELQSLADEKPNLRLHVVATSEGQRLSTEMIARMVAVELTGAKVAFCGPVGLRNALQKGLRRHGVTPRDFHFEEFEFRTGIGLKRLAAWILRRKLPVPEGLRQLRP